VSLEAIFLSTFVMISQNRADAKRQVIANQQWQTVKEEDKQNQQLLELSNQILQLTQAIHEYTSPQTRTSSSGSGDRESAKRYATIAANMRIALTDLPGNAESCEPVGPQNLTR
jgi:uncharacterized membrane protein